MNRDLLAMTDLSGDQINAILDASESPAPPRVLAGRGAALIFEHPSNRTRNAAEMAVFQLGGHPLSIRGEEIGFDRRETVEDIACTLAGYHALIGARVSHHETLERMVGASSAHGFDVPVVNLLSDVEHPSQALADLLTIRQCFGSLEGRRVAFIGDGNNVCRSLVFGLALVGASAIVASPVGFTLNPEDLAVVDRLRGHLECTDRPEIAAEDADVLYTDVWVSMGEEDAATHKREVFAGFAIDHKLLNIAGKDAVVLHCLPAHRGEEITAEVLDGPQSRIWQQAENRLHALRGLLALTFATGE